jgi:glycerophosphoryl diester phosphodiesterase
MVGLLALLPPWAPLPAQPAEPTPTITVISHRCTMPSKTETTLSACVAAAAHGAVILDADVRFTKTGAPVLLHDPHLGLFGHPEILISSVSLATASKYVSSTGQTLMPLNQLRDLGRATGLLVSIEPKIDPTEAQWSSIDATLAPIKGAVRTNSFTPTVLAEARAHGYSPLWLNSNDDVSPAQVPAGVTVVIEYAPRIDAATVAALRAAGVETWCFACDNAATWQRMADLGVTGFATNAWEAARAWVTSR